MADYVVSYLCMPYISFSAAAILHAIDHGYAYGFDVMDITGLPSGTVYPALRRMEEDGLVVSKWEKAETAHKDARPPRKYYELTRSGREALHAAADRYRLPAATSAHPVKPIRPRG
jgi:PadR family transcriptional regulator